MVSNVILSKNLRGADYPPSTDRPIIFHDTQINQTADQPDLNPLIPANQVNQQKTVILGVYLPWLSTAASLLSPYSL